MVRLVTILLKIIIGETCVGLDYSGIFIAEEDDVLLIIVYWAESNNNRWYTHWQYSSRC